MLYYIRKVAMLSLCAGAFGNFSPAHADDWGNFNLYCVSATDSNKKEKINLDESKTIPGFVKDLIWVKGIHDTGSAYYALKGMPGTVPDFHSVQVLLVSKGIGRYDPVNFPENPPFQSGINSAENYCKAIGATCFQYGDEYHSGYIVADGGNDVWHPIAMYEGKNIYVCPAGISHLKSSAFVGIYLPPTDYQVTCEDGRSATFKSIGRFNDYHHYINKDGKHGEQFFKTWYRDWGEKPIYDKIIGMPWCSGKNSN